MYKVRLFHIKPKQAISCGFSGLRSRQLFEFDYFKVHLVTLSIIKCSSVYFRWLLLSSQLPWPTRYVKNNTAITNNLSGRNWGIVTIYSMRRPRHRKACATNTFAYTGSSGSPWYTKQCSMCNLFLLLYRLWLCQPSLLFEYLLKVVSHSSDGVAQDVWGCLGTKREKTRQLQ